MTEDRGTWWRRVRARVSEIANPDAESSNNQFSNEKFVGRRDLELSGWDNAATGALFPGFSAGRDDVVLDIGCGDAPVSLFLADKGARFLAADIVDEVAQEAARRLRNRGSDRVESIVTDANPLPLSDESVTRVVAAEVLEHVGDPAAFMNELVRVGRPNSRYLISVPHSSSEELQRPFAAPDYFDEPNHIRVFRDGDLEEVVENSGLRVLSSQDEGFYYTLWWCFFWACAQPHVEPPYEPLLQRWMETWQLLLDTPAGPSMKAALDERLPKRKVLIAIKDAEGTQPEAR